MVVAVAAAAAAVSVAVVADKLRYAFHQYVLFLLHSSLKYLIHLHFLISIAERDGNWRRASAGETLEQRVYCVKRAR